MKVDVTKYNPAMREELMQQVQMQMSEKRFVHVLGVEEMAVALAKNTVQIPIKPVLQLYVMIMPKNVAMMILSLKLNVKSLVQPY